MFAPRFFLKRRTLYVSCSLYIQFFGGTIKNFHKVLISDAWSLQLPAPQPPTPVAPTQPLFWPTNPPQPLVGCVGRMCGGCVVGIDRKLTSLVLYEHSGGGLHGGLVHTQYDPCGPFRRFCCQPTLPNHSWGVWEGCVGAVWWESTENSPR